MPFVQHLCNQTTPVKYKNLITDEWLGKSLFDNELAEIKYYLNLSQLKYCQKNIKF
jgi:hypothetical protein